MKKVKLHTCVLILKHIADTFIENIKEYCDEKYPGLFQKKRI